MENTEVRVRYELILIVDAKLTKDEKDAILKEALETVAKYGGKVINSQIWLEKQRFTFDIKKRNEGTYYLINFDAPGVDMAKTRAALRLQEKILRFEIIKVE